MPPTSGLASFEKNVLMAWGDCMLSLTEFTEGFIAFTIRMKIGFNRTRARNIESSVLFCKIGRAVLE